MPTGLADEKSVETVASISSSTTVSKNPTTLDTLPTEMKNEIFSYLLLGKNVKTPVPGPDPRFKYHFQTSILLANKNISHAAQSYLYGRNNFAVISIPQTIEDHFSQYMHPAVSRHHVQAIRHHAIRAHFETRQIMSRDAARKKSQTPVASAEPGKTTGILMLLEDLIQLCDSLQLGNHVERGDHIFIMSPPSAKRIKYQVCDIPNLTKTRIFVQLRQTPYLPDRLSSSQELERQKDLLRPFQSLANNIHKVSVKGANDRLSDLLVERLSSRLSWPNAMGWNLFELSLRHADRMAGLRKSGHWDETWFVWDLEANADNASIHNQLMTVSRSRTTLYDKTMPENSADRAVSWQLGITIFAIECYLTTAAFYAKRGDRECFERVVHKALNFVAGVPSLDHLIPFDVVKLVQHCYVLAVALRGTVQDSIRAVEVAKGPTMIKNEIHHAEEGVAAIEHDLSLLHEFIHTEVSAIHSLSVINI